MLSSRGSLQASTVSFWSPLASRSNPRFVHGLLRACATAYAYFRTRASITRCSPTNCAIFFNRPRSQVIKAYRPTLIPVSRSDSNIRIITLTFAISLLKRLTFNEKEHISYLSNVHLSRVEHALQQATEDLRRYYSVRIRSSCTNVFPCSFSTP
jgi:hypothetical protein